MIHFLFTRFSKVQYFLGYCWAFVWRKRSSEFQHKLSLFFFTDEKRKNKITNGSTKMARQYPFIFGFPFRMKTAFSRIYQTSKDILKMDNERFKSVYYTNSRNELSFSGACNSNIKSSFSINNSCEISKLRFSPHINPFGISLRLIYMNKVLMASRRD